MTKQEALDSFESNHGSKTLLMNVPTGSVDTCENWVRDCKEVNFPIKELLTLVAVYYDKNSNSFIEEK